MMIIPSQWKESFSCEKDVFDFFFNTQGEIARLHKNRRTYRLIFLGDPIFVKTHQGIGWREIIKNVLVGKMPIFGAKNEWQALKRLQELNIPSLEAVAYGAKGFNPATQKSFLVTKALEPHQELDRLFKQWKGTVSLRRALIKKLALLARRIHQAGINHRDFYLCHFVVKTDEEISESSQIYVMDLHRAQIRKKVPLRWLLKDLRGLYFSALEVGLSFTDCLRFMKTYANVKHLRDLDLDFWQQVQLKAKKLYLKHYPDTKSHRISGQLPKELSSLQEVEKLFLNPNVCYLKQGDTTTVIKVVLNEQAYVIKRYNVVNVWAKIKRALATSRAERCWNFSQILRKVGIATPKIFSYFEKRKYGFKQESYLVMAFLPGEDLRDLFKIKDELEKNRIRNAVMLDMEKLFSRHITHGDMKLTNFIYNKEKVFFIDLDGMRRHRFSFRLSRAIQKDIARFNRG